MFRYNYTLQSHVCPVGCLLVLLPVADVGVGDGTDVGDGDGVGVGEGEGVVLGVGVGVTPEVGVLWGESVGVTPAVDTGVAPVLVGTTCVAVGTTCLPGPDDEWKYWNPSTDSRIRENRTASIAPMSNNRRPPLRSRSLDCTRGDGLAWVSPSATGTSLLTNG